jgi:hypothetical protein
MGRIDISDPSVMVFPFSGGYGTYFVSLSLIVTLTALVFSYVRIVKTVLLSRREVYAANPVDLPKRIHL